MRKTAEVVIIGGGIVGCTIAAELSRIMEGVVLLERDNIESYASSSNFGMIWQQTRFVGYDTYMSQTTQRLIEEGIREGTFDIDFEYEKAGGLTIAFQELQLDVMRRQCERKREAGVDMYVISRAETLEMEPNLNKNLVGAIFCPNDARANPMLMTMAYANLARNRGALLYENVEVTGIQTKKGKVEKVLTSMGEITTPLVINAAGSWARSVAAMVNIDLPVYPQRLQALVTEPMPKILGNRIIQVARDIEEGMDPEKATGFMFEYEGEQTEENLPKLPVEDTIFTYVQQTLSDTIAIGTTNEFVGLDIRTTPEALSAMMKAAVRVCPVLEESNIIRTWASVVPFTYDGMPILGQVDGVYGFLLATGHGHAMCHAPALAEQIKELVVTGEVPEKIREMSIQRLI